LTLEEKFRESRSQQWSLRWETTHPNGDNYDGVVTDIKKDYVVIAEETAFEFDGLMILPKSSVGDFRDGPFDGCCNEILTSRKAHAAIIYPKWMARCDTIPQLFEAFKRRDIWPGVEILLENDYEFYLGQLTEVGTDEFRLMGYDAAGEWEKEFSIRYDQLFRIEVFSQYCERFNEFMRSKARG
jgi:hypothetical protein